MNLCFRLDEQIPEGLGPLSKRWARLVLPGLVAVSDLTREKSFKVLMKYKDNICHAPELSKHLTKAITSVSFSKVKPFPLQNFKNQNLLSKLLDYSTCAEFVKFKICLVMGMFNVLETSLDNIYANSAINHDD